MNEKITAGNSTVVGAQAQGAWKYPAGGMNHENAQNLGRLLKQRALCPGPAQAHAQGAISSTGGGGGVGLIAPTVLKIGGLYKNRPPER